MPRCLFILCFMLVNGVWAQAPTIPYTGLRVPVVESRHSVLALFSMTCYSTWQLGTEQIAIAGDVVTLTLPIVNNPGGTACVDPPIRREVGHLIGRFEPGNYTLVLQPLAPNPVQPGVDYGPVSAPFVVRPNSPMYSNLRILTHPAIAGRPVTARITARDFYAACFDGPLSNIQRAGNIITLTIRESESGGCAVGVPPPGEQQFDVAIGSYPEGSYTLLVQTLLDVSGGPSPQPLSTNFSVLGAPSAIPSTSFWGLALLILSVCGLAWRRMP